MFVLDALGPYRHSVSKGLACVLPRALGEARLTCADCLQAANGSTANCSMTEGVCRYLRILILTPAARLWKGPGSRFGDVPFAAP